MPRAIEKDEDSRSRRIQSRLPQSYKPLTRAQYASHVVMFEDAFGLSLARAMRADLVKYLKTLSSKGVKRRGIQALRAYIEVLRTEGVRTDDPMGDVSLSVVHAEPPSVHKLGELLMRDGVGRRVAQRLTWRDLTIMSLRAKPFEKVPRRCSNLAGHYLDGQLLGRRALRLLRSRADKELSSAD